MAASVTRLNFELDAVEQPLDRGFIMVSWLLGHGRLLVFVFTRPDAAGKV